MELGKIKWDTAQARVLGEKLKEALGLPETWTSANIKEAKTILKGLVPSELAKLKNSELANSLRNLKFVEWNVDQVPFANLHRLPFLKELSLQLMQNVKHLLYFIPFL